MMNEILKNRKTQFYILALILLAVVPLLFKGLQFGQDFKGGTLIELKLAQPLVPTANVGTQSGVDMQTVVTILQNRLNAFGLRDVTVRPFGNEYIIIQVAETDPTAINQLQSLIGQQGKFEAIFEKNVIMTGEDIVSVITDPQKGYGVRSSGAYYQWTVPFLLTSNSANHFASAVSGKCTIPVGSTDSCQEKVFMFIDRPVNAVVLMPSAIVANESSIPEDFENSATKVTLQDLSDQSGIPIIATDSIDNITISQILNKTVIVPPGYYNTTALQKYASSVEVRPKSSNYWIVGALKLENIVHLTPAVTAGNPITEPTITGSAQSVAQAKSDLDRVVILLKSGKLPVSVSVGSISTISPSLGAEFLNYSVYAGVIAMFAVMAVVFLRYRKLKITIPIMITLVSEILMILGFAAWIGWQLDLVSIAGIIAAVGTGVNDQIIIIDEILRGGTEERMQNIVQKIKKAFSIIFMAAGTIIFAMFPLLFLGLGSLKGFAITTIIGVLVGVFVTRPAFAAWVDKLLT